MVDTLLEIFPKLVVLVLMIYVGARGKRMLRGSSNVVHLVSMIEFVLLKETVDMKLSELECSLVHALLLHIVYFGCVRHLHQLLLNLFDREWSKLFKSDN
jgi:hypothetical protein